MVDGRLHAEGIATPFEIEVVSDELVVMSVFTHDIGLPLQESTNLITTELVKLTTKRLVDRGGHIREVLPRIDAVRPVVKTEVMVQLVQIAIELLIQILDEQALHVVGHGLVVLGFVIDLVADHCRMVGNVGDQLGGSRVHRRNDRWH